VKLAELQRENLIAEAKAPPEPMLWDLLKASVKDHDYGMMDSPKLRRAVQAKIFLPIIEKWMDHPFAALDSKNLALANILVNDIPNHLAVSPALRELGGRFLKKLEAQVAALEKLRDDPKARRAAKPRYGVEVYVDNLQRIEAYITKLKPLLGE
jgi:hypothetical protein